MISAVWSRVSGGLYRRLYLYRDHYENFEPLIIIAELLLISYGLWAAGQDIRALHLPTKDLVTLEFLKERFPDLGEFFIFVVLGISGISRLVIAFRGSALGYTYKQIGQFVDLHGNLNIDDVYARVKQAPLGSAPGVKSDKGTFLAYADAIADRTSELLSVRAYHFRDVQWLKRDRDSLAEWFETFPSALWRLASGGKSNESKPPDPLDKSGYYSVIVPMTAASARAIRRGQKATDLAEVDRKVADAFARKPLDTPVVFLAYVQLHLPQDEKDQIAEELLFAASIQHVAYLLYGTYGAVGDFRTKWNFVILCEAANSRHGSLLERLGFVRLTQKAHERSDAPVRPGKSYAGFPLFELQVVGGQPSGDSDEADARKFINLIEELTTIHWSQAGTPINEASDT
jgi:hypothetical protein